MCIRCGECFKVCPNNVLQPEGFEQGLEGLWTPRVEANWAGCESSCNACGQVCPTGAIRALPMDEKRVARMGLAIVNRSDMPAHGRPGGLRLMRPENASRLATRPSSTSKLEPRPMKREFRSREQADLPRSYSTINVLAAVFAKLVATQSM